LRGRTWPIEGRKFPRCGGIRWKVEDNMDWIIQSKDGSISEITHQTTYDGFLVALRNLFSDPKKQFVSATLSGGAVLDEAAAKALLGGFTIGEGVIGETPI
jgi:hypothetical protein